MRVERLDLFLHDSPRRVRESLSDLTQVRHTCHQLSVDLHVVTSRRDTAKLLRDAGFRAETDGSVTPDVDA